MSVLLVAGRLHSTCSIPYLGINNISWEGHLGSPSPKKRMFIEIHGAKAAWNLGGANKRGGSNVQHAESFWRSHYAILLFAASGVSCGHAARTMEVDLGRHEMRRSASNLEKRPCARRTAMCQTWIK